jgi:hypothetical protein
MINLKKVHHIILHGPLVHFLYDKSCPQGRFTYRFQDETQSRNTYTAIQISLAKQGMLVDTDDMK